MKVSQKMKAAAGLAALVLGMGALAGCDNKPAAGSSNQAAVQERTLELEGRIVKVQPSAVTYIGENTFAGRASNHEFEYVMVKGKGNDVHTLIYPHSKAILEADASITYKPIEQGRIEAKDFVTGFVTSCYGTDDNFTIEAEGIITRDGIRYKQ